MENEAASQKERLNIEESREKRLTRIKAKQRNRGGIFKPKEHNPLLDILMSRDISGRSPTKARSRSRPPSSDHEARDNSAQSRRSAGARATDRRKSTAANASASVAGKGRKQSIGSSNKASIVRDSSTKDRPVEKKTKSATTSRNTSKRSENSEIQEISLPSKRPREDGDEQDIQIDLPSPPKRAKKANASPAASSISRSKPARANRKAPTKSKPESKTKGKTRSSSVNQETQEDGARPSKHKKPAVSKKNGRANEGIEGSVEDQPSTSKPKSARTAAGGGKRATKPKTKRATTRGPRKKKASDDEDRVGLKSDHEKAKGTGKKKTAAEPESETEPEEESHYRPKIPKPRLETVVEEDEEDPNLEVGIEGGNNEPLSSSRTRQGASTLQSNALSQKEGQRRKRTAEDNIESDALLETKAPIAKKTKATVKNSGPRTKVSSTTIEGEDADEVEGKPPPNTRRKPKNSTKTSESEANLEHSLPHPSTLPSTPRRNNSDSKKAAKSIVTGPVSRSKTTSKAKPKSRSKSTKSTSKRAAPAKFANQPILLTSPIKEIDNGVDELDFLSCRPARTTCFKRP